MDTSGPLMSPSASSSTLYSSPMEANDEESDVSSEWDASSEDEEDKKEQKYVNAEMLHVKVHVGVDTCTVYVLFMIVLLMCGALILLLLICCRCFT